MFFSVLSVQKYKLFQLHLKKCDFSRKNVIFREKNLFLYKVVYLLRNVYFCSQIDDSKKNQLTNS